MERAQSGAYCEIMSCTVKPTQARALSWDAASLGAKCQDLAHVVIPCLPLVQIHSLLKARHRSHLLTVQLFTGGDRCVNL